MSDFAVFQSQAGGDFVVGRSVGPPDPIASGDILVFQSEEYDNYRVGRSTVPPDDPRIIDVVNSYLEFNETQYAQAELGRVRKGTFGNGSNLHGEIPKWTPTDSQNFKISFQFQAPSANPSATSSLLAGEGSAPDLYVYQQTNGAFLYRYNDGNSLVWASIPPALKPGQINDIEIAHNEGIVSVTINGESVDSVTPAAGDIHVSAVGIRDTAFPMQGDSSIFNLRLTDLDNPSNSRFYPMDEDEAANEGHDIFYSTNSLGPDLTADWRQTYTEFDVTTSWDGEKLTVVAEDGASDRIEIPVTGLEVGKTYLYEVDLNKAGGELHATIDGATWGEEQWNGVNWTDRRVWRKLVTATATSGVCRIYTAQSTANGGQAGDTLEIYGVSIKETDAGIWHNRTSSDIKDIYLDPIGPSEDFFMAVKFTVFEPPQDDYPMVLSVGGNNGGALVKILLTKTTGRISVEFWERDSAGNATNIGGGSIPDYTSIDWVTPKTCLLVIKKDGATGEHTMWVDGGLTDVRARPTMQYPYGGRIHLNGEWDEDNGVRRSCEGIRIHYACIYEDLTQEDIDAILTDTVDPSTVGVWKQGYLAEGGGKEAFGGNPLTFYNGYKQYLPINIFGATPFFFEMGLL